MREVTGVEGPLLVIKSWAFVALTLWLYRRYLEPMARREPEFESWCAREPLIAALRCDPAQLEQVESQLRSRLGKRRILVATLAGFPWPHYALEICLSRHENVLLVRILRAHMRRAHADSAPALTDVIRDLLNERTTAIEDVWLLPETVHGVHGPDSAPEGWTVSGGEELRPRVVARKASAAWVTAARTASCPESATRESSPGACGGRSATARRGAQAVQPARPVRIGASRRLGR
jgi:hypothetical protein